MENSVANQVAAAKELASRESESLRLFRPLDIQANILQSAARETLVRGGNRSGKSLSSAVRFASIATNIPITLRDGTQFHCRAPHQMGRELTMWCIGYGETHIGQTLYRLLFQKGAFKIIKDLRTNKWRAFDPTDPADLARDNECRPSNPLIPGRYIDPKGWSWKNKGSRLFEKCVIVDPTTKEKLATIYAFTSSGEVKAGDPVDEIWIDEMIQYPSHYAEWQARLIDRAGRLWWSSWPDITNSALLDLTKRAIACKGEEKRPVNEFVLRMSDNPHLPKEAKDLAAKGWTATERRARDAGEYVTDALKMYPRFDDQVHCAWYDDPAKDDALGKILRERGGEPPDDWAREIILDPGTTHPAVLFVAIASPQYGDYVVPYDEIYIPNMDANQLAAAVAKRAAGHQFHRFTIDNRASRQTPMGFGKTILQNYADAFRKVGLVSATTGSSFLPGSDNVSGRIGELQDWMVVRTTGYPKLRIVTKFCRSLCEQLRDYLKDNTNGVQEYKPAKRQHIDVATCLEYLAASNPKWVQPPRNGRQVSPAERMMRLIDRMFPSKSKSDKPIVLGPTA